MDASSNASPAKAADVAVAKSRRSVVPIYAAKKTQQERRRLVKSHVEMKAYGQLKKLQHRFDGNYLKLEQNSSAFEPFVPNAIQKELEYTARGLLHRNGSLTDRSTMPNLLGICLDHEGGNASLQTIAKATAKSISADYIGIDFKYLHEAVRLSVESRLNAAAKTDVDAGSADNEKTSSTKAKAEDFDRLDSQVGEESPDLLENVRRALTATAKKLGKENGASISFLQINAEEDDDEDEDDDDEDNKNDVMQVHRGRRGEFDAIDRQIRVRDYGIVIEHLIQAIKERLPSGRSAVLCFEDYGEFNPSGARLIAGFQCLMQPSIMDRILPVISVTPSLQAAQRRAAMLLNQNEPASDTVQQSRNAFVSAVSKKATPKALDTTAEREWALSLGDNISFSVIPGPMDADMKNTWFRRMNDGKANRMSIVNTFAFALEARRQGVALKTDAMALLGGYTQRLLSTIELRQLLTFAVGYHSSRRQSSASLKATDVQHALDVFQQKTSSQIHEDESPIKKLMRRLQDSHQELNTYEKKLLSSVVSPDMTKVRFKDIACLHRTKEALQSIIALPLLRPSFFQRGILRDSVSGVLLFGPPGTGKTMLAKAIAAECGSTFLNITPSQIYNMYVGEGEKNAKAIFTLARKLAPCVIFIDEVDSIFDTRDASRSYATKREVINEFMAEWDGVASKNNGVIVVGATNRPFDLDDAVLRRLPRRILIDLPTESDREAILRILLRDEDLDGCVSVKDLARRTKLYSGSGALESFFVVCNFVVDLKNVCISAAMHSVRDALRDELDGKDFMQQDGTLNVKAENEQPSTSNEHRRPIKSQHFMKALKEVPSSISEEQESLEKLRRWNALFGDESGLKSKPKVRLGFAQLA